MSPTKRSARAAPAAEGPGPIGSVPMGPGGATHPELGLGLWSMGRWTHEDEIQTRATIERAMARGVPWFDTAEVYGGGRSERLLGDVLARSPPAQPPFLTTKVSWEHLRAAQVRASLTQSLARLGRKRVDVYLVHAPDPSVPLAETMEALATLVREGRVGGVGVSNFSVEQMTEAQRALGDLPLLVNQVKYNLLAPEEGEAVRAYCATHRVVLEAYSPLARGLLVGRYLDGTSPPSIVRRIARDLFDVDRFPELVARARAVRAIAQRADLPLASLALHWLRHRGAVPVFGASRPDQVDEVLAAFGHRPPASALAEVDALVQGAA
jgi:aryl-alcohol dehydrogenase-like predicted oxidoreductase